jgi:hypothetical protein
MPGEPKDDSGQEVRIATASLAMRYEARYDIPIEIEVSGINRDGEVFHERTVTEDVSEWGCAFLLSVEQKKNDIISLRVSPKEGEEIAPAQQAAFQIVRITLVENGWLVGAWKMESKEVWGAEFQKIKNREVAGSESGKEGIAGRGKRRQKDTE